MPVANERTRKQPVCANPECSCPIEPPRKFCSDTCEYQEQSGTVPPCGCGHRDCSGTVPTSLPEG